MQTLQTHDITKQSRKSVNYSLASLTTSEISPAASCGFPDEERAPLIHIISVILTVKSLIPNKLFDCMTDASYQQVKKPIVYKK